jgi:hypothetical protein
MPNSPKFPTTTHKIMSDPAFALGVLDARSGRGLHPDYESWDGDAQWDYERGRQWAALAPGTMLLKRSGKLTPEAVALFNRAGRAIL